MKHKIFCFLFVYIILLFFSPVKANKDYLFSPKGIAEIHITLHDEKKIGDIKRDEPNFTADRLKATMVIKNSATSTYNASELYNGLVGIKGRGNTTWGRPKRPYSLDLVDEAGENNPAALLGMPSDDEWILVAYWNDRSYMRIPLAYYLGSRMEGLAYSPRTRYIELYINGEYRGVYTLTEKIKRGKDRLDISKLTADVADQKLPRITGGYILEVIPHDRVKEKERNTEFKTAKRGITFVFKYPKPKNATDTQVKWIKSYLDEFENVLYGNNYQDPINGYQKYINEDSFIDWTILHELSKGVDNLFHCSVFVHKDRNGKLNMSAPWDFDISFGNHGGSCYLEDEIRMPTTHWFNRLFLDMRFKNKLIERYEELTPLFDEIPDILETNLKQLEESGCLERDYEKFPKIFDDFVDKDGRTTPTTVRGHAQWLNEWIGSRRTWMGVYYGYPQIWTICDRIKETKPVIRIMDPEGFNAGGPSDVRLMSGFRYLWDNNILSVSPIHLIDDDEEHVVQIMDTHGCLSLPTKIRRGNNDTSIGSQQVDNLSINSYMLGNTLFTNYSADRNSELDVYVYNMQGVLIKQTKYEMSVGFNQNSLTLSGIPNGFYIVKYVIDTKVISNKITVRL